MSKVTKKPIPNWLTIPTEITLKKYGLTRSEYLDIAERQNFLCPICKNRLEKQVNIDHFHVANWKKYPANIRKLYVRGITDWWCNKTYLGKGITIEKSRNVTTYLEAFEQRKPR